MLDPATSVCVHPPAGPLFHPASGSDLPDCFLANVRPGNRVLVAIHGVSRNAAEIAARFAADPAYREVTIIAPLFDRKQFGKYQQMIAERPGSIPADQALLGLLASLERSHGLDCGKVLLFGFSGGAQMAHRFAMFHPAKVKRLCVVSAGWYTLPNTKLSYPYGLADAPSHAAIGSEFLEIPTVVMVGSRDTRVDHSVRQDPQIIQHQGRNRLRRARVWVKMMQVRAASCGHEPDIHLVTVPDVSHDFGQSVKEGNLMGLVAEALL